MDEFEIRRMIIMHGLLAGKVELSIPVGDRTPAITVLKKCVREIEEALDEMKAEDADTGE